MATYKFPSHRLPEKSAPQPHTAPVLKGFLGPLPSQTAGSPPPQYLTPLTSEKQGGINHLWSRENRAWLLLGPASATPETENHNDVLQQLLHAISNYSTSCFAAVLSLASQWPTKDTELENTGFKSFLVQLISYPYTFFAKIFKHQTLRYHGSVFIIYFVKV